MSLRVCAAAIAALFYGAVCVGPDDVVTGKVMLGTIWAAVFGYFWAMFVTWCR